MVVFDSHRPVVKGEMVVWTESDSDLLLLREGGLESDLVTPDYDRIKGPFSGMGVLERGEEMLSEWVFIKLGEFSSFLGLSYEGFEEEILGLFKRIVMKRGRNTSEGVANSVLCRKLKNELKKLECDVNYDQINGGG